VIPEEPGREKTISAFQLEARFAMSSVIPRARPVKSITRTTPRATPTTLIRVLKGRTRRFASISSTIFRKVDCRGTRGYLQSGRGEKTGWTGYAGWAETDIHGTDSSCQLIRPILSILSILFPAPYPSFYRDPYPSQDQHARDGKPESHDLADENDPAERRDDGYRQLHDGRAR